ncbi:hypothetical protein DSECCO2_444280 [anaerobic digester metagenome]
MAGRIVDPDDVVFGIGYVPEPPEVDQAAGLVERRVPREPVAVALPPAPGPGEDPARLRVELLDLVVAGIGDGDQPLVVGQARGVVDTRHTGDGVEIAEVLK